MLPKTDASAVPCSNISSNCVIWQGPDIPCIELCTGDTVSDVVAALAQQLCDLVIPEPDADGLDLLCVLPQGQGQPTKLKDVVQLIIDYVCDLEGGEEFELPIIGIPACLLPYTDPDTGESITSLPLDEFALLLATKICEILDQINLINIQLADHEIRINILEDCVLDADGNCNIGGGDPDVFSTCILPDQTVAASVLLLALETAFCNLQDAVGSPPLITAAINQAGCITASDPMLGSAGTYGGVNGWVNTPTTLAHAVGNAWIVICDMHQAIQTIQANCCPGPCDETVFAYETNLATNAQGVTTGVEFTFTNSNIPSGFTDCGGNTTITITDTNNVVATQNFVFSNYAGTSTVFTFNLSNTSLNLAADLDVSISFCITNGTDQCEQVITSTVENALACPTNFAVSDISETDAFITFSNPYGPSAVYTFTITDLDDGSSNNVITATNLAGVAQVHITGLDAGTDYAVAISLQVNGVTVQCTTLNFTSNEDIGVPVGQAISTSGNAGEYLIPVQVGTAAGTFTVHWDSQGIPDRLQIYASAVSNDFNQMQIVADSLYIGTNVSPTIPPNGPTQNLNQYTYVGDGTGNATGAGEPGNDWNITGPGTVTITITDSDVCNNTSQKTGSDPTNGAARAGAAGAQIGVRPFWYDSATDYANGTASSGGNHSNGHCSISFTKLATTSSVCYIRVESQNTNTLWDIYGTDFI